MECPPLQVQSPHNWYTAGSLNQGAANATASSYPNLKADHQIEIFKIGSDEAKTLGKHPTGSLAVVNYRCQ